MIATKKSIFKKRIFIYLAALDLSCSTQEGSSIFVPHVGHSSLTRDRTWDLCIGSTES